MVGIFNLEIEHGLVHVVTPRTANEAGVDGSGDRVGVIGINASAPEGAPGANFLSVRLIDPETGHSDGKCAILPLFEARKGLGGCCISKLGAVQRGLGRGGTDARCVERRAKVVPRKMGHTRKQWLQIYGSTRLADRRYSRNGG